MSASDRSSRTERLERAIRLKKAAARSRPPDMEPRPDDRTARLGEMQRSLWLVHQMDPSSPAYNLASATRVEGSIDPPALERGFNRVVERHRLLRSTFQADGGAVRQIVRPHEPMQVDVLRVAQGAGLEAAVAAAQRPFDLESGPLIRLSLIRETPEGGSYLLLVLHHILADERSLSLLWSELSKAYADDLPGDEPRVQYDDYVHWLSQREPGEQERELDHWRRRLDPLPDELVLPFEKPASDGPQRGRLMSRALDLEVQRGIRELATDTGSSPFTVYAAAFRLLLQRYTDNQRIAFATPVSTRSHPATAEMIGYFTNPVVVVDAVDEDQPVRDAVRAFGRGLRDTLSHGSVPFPVLAEQLAPPRRRDRHPIFQTMFVYQQSESSRRLGDALLEPVTLDLGAAKFDLTLFVTEGDESLSIAVEYRADRFDDRWMDRLLGHFEHLLVSLPKDAGRLTAEVPMLDPDELRSLREVATGPLPATDGSALVPHRILDIASRSPRSPALVCGGVRRSYGELVDSAQSIAGLLREHGVVPGDRVAVFLDRSVEMIEAVVGIHLAGAGYVPLDPSYPEARTRLVLDDAAISAVVTRAALDGGLPQGSCTVLDVDQANPPGLVERTPPELSPETAAYVLYTSGSTGQPKGVVVSHRNLQLSTDARHDVYESSPSRYLLLPSLAFDSSVAGIFWTLTTGGTLVIPTDDEVRDVRRLTRLMADERVTTLLCVPSLYAQLLRAGAHELGDLETAIVAGESCPSPLVEQHLRHLGHAGLYNEYGPTEATVWATVHRITDDDIRRPVAIGRPIPGVRIDVVDGRGRPVPIGIPGHGWIAGPTVAQGYWRRPDLTDDRFVADDDGGPFARRYRTGDRMAWSDDGRLIFLGRDDEQIKLRGYRIEPGEIESILLDAPGVEHAVVVERPVATASSPPRTDSTQLVAFVEGDPIRPLTSWRNDLAARLPDFMIPARLVTLPRLPRLPNGKIDRRTLRVMDLEPEAASSSREMVTNTGHHTLIALWEGLLGCNGVGLDDNFFELGGHSLLVLEMVLAIEQDLGVSLSAADVFDDPTVRGLGRKIAERSSSTSRPYRHLFPIQPTGDRTPLVVAIPHFFTDLFAHRFRGERPVYGLRGVGHRAEGNLGRWRTMTELGEELVEEVSRRFPDTEIIMAGYSFGASMAFEAVRLMEARGLPVRKLVLIAPMPEDFYRFGPFRIQIDGLRQSPAELSASRALRRYLASNNPLTRRPYQRAWRWLAIEPWRRLLCQVGKLRRRVGLPLTPRILWADVRVDRFRLHAGYRPQPISTPTVFFNPDDTATDAAATWRPFFKGPLTVLPIPDPHHGDAAVDAAKTVILENLEDLED